MSVRRKDAMTGSLLKIELCVCIALTVSLAEGPSKDKKKEVSSLPFWINFPSKPLQNNLMTMIMIV